MYFLIMDWLEIKSDARPTPRDMTIAVEISPYPGKFFLINSMKKVAIMQVIMAPIIGCVPANIPIITPAKETWDRASPITEIFLFTNTIPINGITMEIIKPTISALIIYE